MHTHPEIILNRDCEAIQIPSGTIFTLPAGTKVTITQSLGSSYTVGSLEYGLARINAENADALGLEPTVTTPKAVPEGGFAKVEEETIWEQLRTCYDPEIPVNIVDLGLVYDCRVDPQPAGTVKVEVKMTLTAPGCGMGPVICAEAKSKILGIPGVEDAEVELVWDPPWNQGMISEVGRMKLGLI